MYTTIPHSGGITGGQFSAEFWGYFHLNFDPFWGRALGSGLARGWVAARGSGRFGRQGFGVRSVGWVGWLGSVGCLVSGVGLVGRLFNCEGLRVQG